MQKAIEKWHAEDSMREYAMQIAACDDLALLQREIAKFPRAATRGRDRIGLRIVLDRISEIEIEQARKR